MTKQMFLLIVLGSLYMNLFAQLIPDNNFKAVINDKLGEPPNYEPTIEDLNNIYGTLYANFEEIDSIEGAQYLINLGLLELRGNQINDISPLSGLQNLLCLDLGYNQISTISSISNLTNLQTLILYLNQISDISAVSELTNLSMLWLNYNQIDDISPIANLTNLSHLRLYNNQITDITPVSNLTNLTYLYLNYNQITDISIVADLTNLEYLALKYNQINNITAVAGLLNLYFLDLDYNQITDITPVSNLTNLTFLGLNYNQITDIISVSSLLNLNILRLSSNQISDITPLVENTELGFENHLHLFDNYLSQEAIDVHIPILEDRGFQTLWYSSNPNIYAACYPNPIRNEIEVPINTTLEWRGNFPSRDAVYDVWLGETSDNLVNIGTGVALNDTLYSFIPNLNEDTNYWWKVRAITETDTLWSGLWHFAVGNPISTNDDIQSLNVSQIVDNFPNPFNPSTTIRYELIESGFTKIEVFNIKGQKIKTLVNQYQIAGEKSIVWNGIDTKCNPVSSGIYILKLNVNENTQSLQKCILLK